MARRGNNPLGIFQNMDEEDEEDEEEEDILNAERFFEESGRELFGGRGNNDQYNLGGQGDEDMDEDDLDDVDDLMGDDDEEGIR